MNDSLNFNNLSATAKVGSIMMGFVLNFFAPVWPFLLILLLLVASDTIVGRWAAKRRGDELTPEKEGKVVMKLAMYPLVILLSEGMVKVFFNGLPVVDGMTYAVALYICTLEFRSVVRNVGEATGIDIWTAIADWLGSRNKRA
jgi:hypothetical protein